MDLCLGRPVSSSRHILMVRYMSVQNYGQRKKQNVVRLKPDTSFGWIRVKDMIKYNKLN